MDLRDLIKERVLVIDGAMGTMIQPRAINRCNSSISSGCNIFWCLN